jgi:hypothetical protein
MTWSPYQIGIVLHHHVSHGKFPLWTAPAYEETVGALIKAGILEQVGGEGRITTTPLGTTLVGLWCETPLPVQVFVDPRQMAGVL